MGEVLSGKSPLFCIPTLSKSVKKFQCLSYNDICKADKLRTKLLGLDDIPFRSHLRRRGGASDLFDAGIPLKEIKVVGH